MPNVTGFARPSLADLISRIQNDINARLPGADSRLRRSVLSVIAFVLAGAVHLLYGFIGFVAAQILVDTASKEFLDRHSAIWGVPRLAAAKATGNVTFTGTNAIVIPVGTVLQRSDGEQFITDAEATIAAGTALVGVMAVLAGLSGETASASALALVSPISGINSVAAVDSTGLTGAADTESDAALRVRILERIQKPPEGGAASDYVAWAKLISGVTRVFVFPLELGIGRVTVRFVRDDDAGGIIPDAAEIQAVQDKIDSLRPVTADVTVVAPVAAVQDFTIQVSPDTTAIRAAVLAELTDLVAREAEPGKAVFLSRINEAISKAEGEFDHTLTVPAANVVLTDSQIGTMGTITWV